MAELFIAGAQGFGLETLDLTIALGQPVDGFLDDFLDGQTRRGLRVLNPDEAPENARYVVAIADPPVRRHMVTRLEGAGLWPTRLIHPRAIVSPQASIDQGCIVLAGAYVSSDVSLGAHVHVNYNATLGHDTSVESFVTVLPGSNIAGSVRLQHQAIIGSGAVILQGLTIGHRATVGAGAVVTHNVPPNCTYTGVPARPMRHHNID